MMSIKDKLGRAAAICAIGGTLGGCTSVEPVEDDSEELKVTLVATSQVVSIIAGVLSGASSLKNLFGGSEGPEFVSLTEDALDDIENIVIGVTVEFGFEQYVNRLNALVEKIGTYHPPGCQPEGDAECRNEFRDASDKLWTLAGNASEVWSSFNSNGDLHAPNRMQHVPSMVTIAGLRTAMLVERAKVDTQRGQNGPSSWEDACEAADGYLDRLTRLEDEEYTAYIDSQFSPIYSKVVDQEYLPSSGSMRIWVVGCIMGPNASGDEQEWCADGTYDRRRLDCGWADCDNHKNENGDRILNTPVYSPGAVDLRKREVDRYYAQVRPTILGGSAFDDVLAELDRISKCEDKPSNDPPPTPEAEPDSEPEPEPKPACGAEEISFSDGPYPNMTTGTYVRAADDYNGEPVYQRTGGNKTWSIYKRSNGNWVLDVDDIDEVWSGTVDYTTNKPASPWEGVWNTGSAECL